MSDSQMPRLISLGAISLLIAVLGVTFYRVVAPFVLPMFLAGIVAIICRPMFLWFLEKSHGRRRIAAGSSTAVVLLAVLTPLSIGTVVGSIQLLKMGRQAVVIPNWPERLADLRDSEWTERAAEWIAPLIVDADLPTDIKPVDDGADPALSDSASPDDVMELQEEPVPPGSPPAVDSSDDTRKKRLAAVERRVTETVQQGLAVVAERTLGSIGGAPGLAFNVLGRLAGALLSIVIFTVSLYFYLADGPRLLMTAEQMVPVEARHQKELVLRFDEAVRAVVLSTFAAAITQGFLTAAAVSISGIGNFFILFLFATFMALIPLLGTWTIWGPAAVYLAIEGHWLGAIILVAFGVGIINTIDNVIRIYVLGGAAKLHPLLALVSVLGGLQLMGIWGVFIAPIIASCLHALIVIFNEELKGMAAERSSLIRKPDGNELRELTAKTGD
ncbi:AI-2E family transporter [Stratiformator vulcanicus]|uniref:Putative inner membrane protein n=1 Tax=Stratiformator vulcanicus TaxID=2527980 RepID=A0A517QYN3_9PLAN|nr:AI-2E family transporter [Stratiformator vulcanicus]QDT36708.1 putative inner membrane protein [Stratiformator vulcanicus]